MSDLNKLDNYPRDPQFDIFSFFQVQFCQRDFLIHFLEMGYRDHFEYKKCHDNNCLLKLVNRFLLRTRYAS